MSLAVVLDCLLPGGMGFPCATAIDLAQRVVASTKGVSAIEPLLSMLPEDFTSLSSPARLDILREIEAYKPDLFAAFLHTCYVHYYTHPVVEAAIERETGYAARAPLPDGYSLAPFDETLLAIPRGRPPHYRLA